MYWFFIVQYIDEVKLSRLYYYTLGRPIQSLPQLPREYSALNTGLTAGA